MVAWTGIENFRVGRFDPPPPVDEPEDTVVCKLVPFQICGLPYTKGALI